MQNSIARRRGRFRVLQTFLQRRRVVDRERWLALAPGGMISAVCGLVPTTSDRFHCAGPFPHCGGSFPHCGGSFPHCGECFPFHTAADRSNTAADRFYTAAHRFHTAADRFRTAADRFHTAAHRFLSERQGFLAVRGGSRSLDKRFPKLKNRGFLRETESVGTRLTPRAIILSVLVEAIKRPHPVSTHVQFASSVSKGFTPQFSLIEAPGTKSHEKIPPRRRPAAHLCVFRLCSGRIEHDHLSRETLI